MAVTRLRLILICMLAVVHLVTTSGITSGFVLCVGTNGHIAIEQKHVSKIHDDCCVSSEDERVVEVLRVMEDDRCCFDLTLSTIEVPVTRGERGLVLSATSALLSAVVQPVVERPGERLPGWLAHDFGSERALATIRTVVLTV